MVLILSGCAVGVKDIKRQYFTFKYSGEIKGNYSAAARCVIKDMESHEGLAISSLDYNLRVYPDIKESEIRALDAHNGPHLDMLFNTTSDDTLDVTINGMEHVGPEALKALQRCANK